MLIICAVLFITAVCHNIMIFLSEFPIRRELNIRVVTGNSFVCSLEGIGRGLPSSVLSNSQHVVNNGQKTYSLGTNGSLLNLLKPPSAQTT